MGKSNKLLKNTLILLVGKFCTQFLSFFLLPIYTNTLNTSTYGVFDLLQSYVVVLIPIINLEIEMALYKFLIDSRKNNTNDDDIIYTSFYFSFLFAVLFVVVVLILYLITKRLFFIYIGIMLFFNVFTNLCLQLIRGRGDNLVYAKACFISAFFNLLSCILFLYILKLGLIGAVLSIVISNFICIVYTLLKEKIIINFKKGKKDFKLLKTMLKYSLPLIPSSIIWWVINVSDRTLISLYMGTSYNGIYAVSYKFPSIINSIFNIFVMSWTEIVLLYIDQDDDGFINNTFNIFIKFVCGFSLILNSGMFILFRILVNSNFYDAYNYVLPLVFSNVFSCIVAVIGPIYLANNKTKEVAKTSIISGILNVLINIIFIKKYGLYAAAFSTLLSFLVVAIYRFIDSKKYVKLNLNIKEVFVFMFFVAVNILLYYSNNIYLNILNIIIMFIYFIVINYKTIVNKLNKLRCKLDERKN